MRIPSEGNTEVYDISDTEYASVKLDDSGRFWVNISRIEKPVESMSVTVKDSNSLWLDTFEEVKEYLLEKANEAHKANFRE